MSLLPSFRVFLSSRESCMRLCAPRQAWRCRSGASVKFARWLLPLAVAGKVVLPLGGNLLCRPLCWLLCWLAAVPRTTCDPVVNDTCSCGGTA